MENTKLPAYPLINQEGTSLEDRSVFYGFTKLELASLMIAQGAVGDLPSPKTFNEKWPSEIAPIWVSIAKAVLEEANK